MNLQHEDCDHTFSSSEPYETDLNHLSYQYVRWKVGKFCTYEGLSDHQNGGCPTDPYQRPWEVNLQAE